MCSGNVPMKKPKQSSAKRDEIKVDFISRLPDVLLIQILSLLTEVDANRTRILSNRWKDLWAFLPDLRFVMPYCRTIKKVKKFHDSVDQTLALRGGMLIRRFFLDCSKKCDYNRFYDSIVTVVQCRVKELELKFPCDRFRVRFCWDLFKTCNTLVRLSLEGAFVLDVPEAEVLFPYLKKISLVSVVYSGDQSFANLISGCPVLQELHVVRSLFAQSDNLETFKVFSPSLKRLRMLFFSINIWNLKAVINAPKLEYVYIFDLISTDFKLTEPLSLVEASVRKNYGSIVELIRSLSSARILTLDTATMRSLSYINNLHLPMFPNLFKLAIGINWNWDLLLDLLNNMPHLRHMTLTYRVLNKSRGLPVEAPACLRFKMNKIILLNDQTVERDDMILIRYLLEHSNILKMFRLNAHEITPKRREQILNFHRGSNFCHVEFV